MKGTLIHQGGIDAVGGNTHFFTLAKLQFFAFARCCGLAEQLVDKIFNY